MLFLSGHACLIQLSYLLCHVRLDSIPTSQKSNSSLDRVFSMLSLLTSRGRHFVAQIPRELTTLSLQLHNSVLFNMLIL